MGLKIGFFGGSFDPIHFGHLQLAKELMEAKDLDKVWFCPALISPHKLDQIPVPVEHRLKMVRLAIEGCPAFEVIDAESQRKGPSYTIDTLRYLVEKEKKEDNQLFLILSEEAVPGFFHWKNPEEIIKLAPLLIGTRSGPIDYRQLPKGREEIKQSIESGWVPTTPNPFSSTEIRKRLRKGEDCRGLLPKKVLDYIHQNNLYL